MAGHGNGTALQLVPWALVMLKDRETKLLDGLCCVVSVAVETCGDTQDLQEKNDHERGHFGQGSYVYQLELKPNRNNEMWSKRLVEANI